MHASGVFERALTYFRTSAPELKEERAMLLEEWLNLESSFGEVGDVDLVRTKLPKKLKKRRQIETEDGPAGYVEKCFFYKLTSSQGFDNISYTNNSCQLVWVLIIPLGKYRFLMNSSDSFSNPRLHSLKLKSKILFFT